MIKHTSFQNYVNNPPRSIKIDCLSFQDYQVLNMLGRGGFACVYRAHSLITGQEVAIKMVCFNLKFIHNAEEYKNTLSEHYSLLEMFQNTYAKML